MDRVYGTVPQSSAWCMLMLVPQGMGLYSRTRLSHRAWAIFGGRGGQEFHLEGTTCS